MANKYPPYVNAYGKIGELLEAIKSASVPAKFTFDFLHTVLGLKSTSFRAMIPLLKNLGLLDGNSVPTQAYKDFRDDGNSKWVLAKQVREAYKDLFQANEFAYRLNRDELKSKLKTLLGVGDDDSNLPSVVGTFAELVKFSEFDGKTKSHSKKDNKDDKTDSLDQAKPLVDSSPFKNESDLKFGISYTINLNLPATTEIEVFNAIFKSLKENLLKNE